MNNLKPLLIFVGKFFLFYIAFVVLVQTTGFTDAYRNGLVGVYSSLYSNIYENADIKTEGIKGHTGDDVQFTFANKLAIEKAKAEARQTGQVKTNIRGFKWSFNTYRVDLMFVLFLLALILAYPSSILKKVISLLISLGIYYLISFSLLGGRMLYKFHLNQSVFPEYNLSKISEQFLSTATNMHTEGMFFIAILIWAIVMIDRNDFQKLKLADYNVLQ